MTNELLAQLIGKGDNDELIPLLWEKTRRWYYEQADKFVRKYTDRCIQFGITKEDMRQECYFIMLDSIKAYNNRKEEQRELKFITFCGLQFLNKANKLIGLKKYAGYGRLDVLNNTPISLDATVSNARGDEEDTAFGELLPDNSALDKVESQFNKIGAEDSNRLVEVILEKFLEGREREIIERRYIKHETTTEISESWGCTRQNVSCVEKTALKRLRNNRYIMRLNDVYDAYCGVGLVAFKANLCSVVERIVEQKEYYNERKKVIDSIISDSNSWDGGTLRTERGYQGKSVWIYHEELKRPISEHRRQQYKVEAEAIIDLINDNEGITIKEIKEKLNTSLGISGVKQLIYDLGYKKEFVSRLNKS